MFALRSVKIQSRQRQEVRKKNDTKIESNNRREKILTQSIAVNSLHKFQSEKNRYHVSFRTTLCETRAKLQAKKEPLTLRYRELCKDTYPNRTP